LVAILDADKQGFLRSQTALIQTIGRAARHVSGKVIMYADKITEAMEGAINETNRRREIQVAYNQKHNIEPISIIKAIRDLTDRVAVSQVAESAAPYEVGQPGPVPKKELESMIEELEARMKQAAADLEFETAAMLRDQVYELRTILAEDESLKPWEKIKVLAGQEYP
jgi:excinuclease ABC subunit B